MLRAAVRVLIGVAVCAAFFPGVAMAERVKGRVYDVDERHSEVSLDVAGRHHTYHIEDRTLYRVLRRDHVVLVRAEVLRGRHTIVDAEPAVLEGRVEKVDLKHNKIVIRDAQTKTRRTYLLDPGAARDLKTGQNITYDFEERGSHDVITRWHRP
ncbi:MAG TPA: hypothetical protein VGI12_11490 [Vicinamibacterales bacterium]|jgi:hypothetical protein